MALPSRFEGTAGVALEAMGVGTPIVASGLVGLEGILVDGDNALLVPSGDSHALAKALARVLDDRALAAELTAVGTRDFERRFTLARSAEAMVALYRDTLDGRRRPFFGRDPLAQSGNPNSKGVRLPP
jgi:glycosyltransferase involved in cell wall biosynthesis